MIEEYPKLQNCKYACHMVLILGKPVYTKTDEFPENFRKGGEGSFLIQKISLQFFLL